MGCFGSSCFWFAPCFLLVPLRHSGGSCTPVSFWPRALFSLSVFLCLSCLLHDASVSLHGTGASLSALHWGLVSRMLWVAVGDGSAC